MPGNQDGEITVGQPRQENTPAWEGGLPPDDGRTDFTDAEIQAGIQASQNKFKPGEQKWVAGLNPVSGVEPLDEDFQADLDAQKAAAAQPRPMDGGWKEQLQGDDASTLSVSEIMDKKSSGDWDKIDSKRNRTIVLLDSLFSAASIGQYLSDTDAQETIMTEVEEYTDNNSLGFDQDVTCDISRNDLMTAARAVVFRLKNSTHRTSNASIDSAVDALFKDDSFLNRTNDEKIVKMLAGALNIG